MSNIIRPASEKDYASILEIYAPFVDATPVTFETKVPTEEEFKKRIQESIRIFPWLVSEIDGKIAGYTYASPHRSRHGWV